jgi:hypothetical protein
MARDAGFAAMVKSGVEGGVTVTETVALWIREPLVPVTVAM